MKSCILASSLSGNIGVLIVYLMDFTSMSAVSTANIGDTIYGVSFRDCKNECLDRPACAIVDYNRNYHRCLLFSMDENTSGDSVWKPGSFQTQGSGKASENNNQSIVVKCDPSNICIRTGCPSPQVSNGKIYGNIVRIGARIQVVCESGFNPLNETSAICDHDGTWTNILECVRLFECGIPPNISNAEVTMTSSFVARYSCLSGFKQIGSDNITTCSDPEGWKSVNMSCLKICGEPTIIPNTALSYAPNVEGQIRIYTCLDGFSTPNGTTRIEITCGSHGNWSKVDLTCLSGCVTLPSITNGLFDTGGVDIGSVRQYVCDTDHTNGGQRKGMIECSPKGIWEPSGPIACEPLESLGQFCMNDGYCLEPNTICFRSWCTCKPLHKYSFTENYCYKSCDSLSNTFTQINQTYVGWYWTDEITLGNHETCESNCIADSTCLIYEHLHADAQDCRFGTLSLQQFQDALPNAISYDYSSSKLFVRNCGTDKFSGASGLNAGSGTIAQSTEGTGEPQSPA